jgi:hypothetical protein
MPTGVRIYLDAKTYPNTTGYVGVSWPDITQKYNSSAHAVVSIRPEVSLLTQGNFDASLHAFMLTAPAGTASLLTMWHEAATDALDPTNDYPTHPDLFREGLARMQALAAGQIPGYGPTNVKVGVIDVNPSAIPLSAYSSAQDAYNTWMAANLDWYGCDLYDNKDLTLSAYDELNQFRDLVNTLPGSDADADAPINLPECNSRSWTDAQGVVHSTAPTSGPTGFRRSDFFHYAWAWLQNIGPASHCSGLLGFWRQGAPEGSPSGWPPVDDPAGSLSAMVAELSAENADSWP